MAASKLQMHVSSLRDKISTKFQQLCLCFRGLAFHWDSSHDYATRPEVEKSKMAASKLQMHQSLLPNKISTKFRRLNPRFWVQHSNGTRSKIVQPNRKWVIQDGGFQTSNACIFASRQDINEIPTAMLIFWGFSFPLGLITWLCDQTGSGKIQDGGRHALIACFSAPRQDSDTIPTAKPMFFGSSIPTGLVQRLCNQTGSG